MKPRLTPPPDPRPRLAVVVPLLAVCFLAVIFFIRQAWQSQERPSGIQPEEESGATRQSGGVSRAGRPSRGTESTDYSFRRTAGPGAAAESDVDADQTPVGLETVPAEAAAHSAPVLPFHRSGTLDVPRFQSPGGGEMKGTITLRGTPPPERALPLDPTCGRLHTNRPTTRFFVVGPDQGLADVFVWISAGVAGRPSQRPTGSVLLDQVGCEYVPYVSGLQTGQTLLVRNSDPLLHNVHPTPTVPGNRESNRAQPAGSRDLSFVFPAPEILLRFKCDIHPWMFAYVGVVEHSFFAVTDANGVYSITNVPPGRYTLEAFHRKAGRAVQELLLREGESRVVDFVLDVPASLSGR